MLTSRTIMAEHASGLLIVGDRGTACACSGPDWFPLAPAPTHVVRCRGPGYACSRAASSPVQCQTQRRLQEARRLMRGEHLDAASAGARVGYADAAYASRVYARLFGARTRRSVGPARRATSRRPAAWVAGVSGAESRHLCRLVRAALPRVVRNRTIHSSTPLRGVGGGPATGRTLARCRALAGPAERGDATARGCCAGIEGTLSRGVRTCGLRRAEWLGDRWAMPAWTNAVLDRLRRRAVYPFRR